MTKERKEQSDKRPRKIVKRDITKDQFFALLDKACQPIKKSALSGSVQTKTLESGHHGGYSGRHTHSRKIEETKRTK